MDTPKRKSLPSVASCFVVAQWNQIFFSRFFFMLIITKTGFKNYTIFAIQYVTFVDCVCILLSDKL